MYNILLIFSLRSLCVADDLGIVYCWKKVYCDSMEKTLNEAGLKAYSYHAGRTEEYRESVQNMWKENKCQVICATVAFGMGIHKPDVRYVIHSVLPKSMERYQRETGRAGRDGNLSHCILFYNNNDYHQLHYVISNSMKRELDNLNRVVQYCGNEKVCRRAQLLSYFSEVKTEANLCEESAEAICDNCESANKKKVMNFKEEGEGEMT
ncbi:recQ-like DNA helicase BLM isoform X4 [Gadus macrocephalus]|uniref:recQ-like DNA helicase BLM isoform X4 n=1 Tax=Gadus macrocephalus TaxID=80720 RepID=UPI0028CB89FD|nr:recQ-like DNA helicase BLM isoform X4 [Gadus macrocephalus]